jgi:hypothetical protein
MPVIGQNELSCDNRVRSGSSVPLPKFCRKSGPSGIYRHSANIEHWTDFNHRSLLVTRMYIQQAVMVEGICRGALGQPKTHFPIPSAFSALHHLTQSSNTEPMSQSDTYRAVLEAAQKTCYISARTRLSHRYFEPAGTVRSMVVARNHSTLARQAQFRNACECCNTYILCR